MTDLQHLREQAQLCLRMAQTCSDGVVAEGLRLLAADFAEQADDAERDATTSPREPADSAVESRGLGT